MTRFPALATIAAFGVVLVSAGPAEAKGCVRGAVAGAVAGHFAHHHAIMGAAAGCAIAHHHYSHKARAH